VQTVDCSSSSTPVFSAPTVDCSSSSTPVFSAPTVDCSSSGLSNTSEPTDHSLVELQCMWVGPDGSCNDQIRHCDFPSHLREVHGMTGQAIVTCRWHGCNKALRRDSIWRHVREIHLGIGRKRKQAVP
ncbi:hypothetical protein CY34DRAFT_639388, partial [Suillus luteus UH-Slu-Lm8-n1]